MYSLDKQKFGSFVSERRRALGLTQRSLAERLSVSDKAVSKWETGVLLIYRHAARAYWMLPL